MPYGTITHLSKYYILRRAKQSGLPAEVLGLDPNVPDFDIENSIPEDFPVKPVVGVIGGAFYTTCSECGLSWNDRIATAYTPVPSGRCPFESFHVTVPDNLYEIAVIVDGALDESFYVQTDYEANIADWIAETLHIEADGPTSWEVLVTEYAYEDAGAIRYRVTSGDHEPS